MSNPQEEYKCKLINHWFLREFLDFPTAWEIQHRVGGVLDHDSECSSRPQWNMLCDCGAIDTYWKWLATNPELIPKKLPTKEDS